MAEKRKYSRKYCTYCEALSERFKIMPRRLTGNCKKHQEMVEASIKRARHAAIVPYVIDTKRVVVNPFDIL
jgi:small subunit ribosomal protein S18